MADNIIVLKDGRGKRIDVFLSVYLKLTRSYIQKLIRDGYIKVNDKPVKPNKILKEKDAIFLNLPALVESEVLPKNIPLDILYEDNEIIVINKPAGLVIHPAPSVKGDTLVNALLFHTKSLSNIGGNFRPGIIHRLDKDTSGLLIIAKTNKAHMKLIDDMKNRAIVKKYIVLVKGEVKDNNGKIETSIGRHPRDRKKFAVVVKGGKKAITHFRTVKRLNGYTLLKIDLKTGRTHQIRVHMKYLGHPVAGDKVYGTGDSKVIERQALHAFSLRFLHPATGKLMHFRAPIPSDIKKAIRNLQRAKT